MRVLVFGDSIAQGYHDLDGGWVARMRKYYDTESRNGGRDITVFNQAISASSSRDLIKNIEVEIQARSDSSQDLVVIIAIGMNDSRMKGDADYSSVEEYKKNLIEIIDTVKKYTEKILFVGLSPVIQSRTNPVSWNTTRYLKSRVETFDAALNSVASDADIEVVNVKDALNEAQETEEHISDGLHPDDNGHEVMFQTIVPEFEKLIS